MPTTDAPAFYPEAALEDHGLTPDDFGSAGVYALALEQPPSAYVFADSWAGEYEVAPPDELSVEVVLGRKLIYVGATGCLLDRLHDHVAGDKRRVGLLAVCPPTGVDAVWPEGSADAAFERERQRAYAYRDANDGVAVWCDGGLV